MGHPAVSNTRFIALTFDGKLLICSFLELALARWFIPVPMSHRRPQIRLSKGSWVLPDCSRAPKDPTRTAPLMRCSTHRCPTHHATSVARHSSIQDCASHRGAPGKPTRCRHGRSAHDPHVAACVLDILESVRAATTSLAPYSMSEESVPWQAYLTLMRYFVRIGHGRAGRRLAVPLETPEYTSSQSVPCTMYWHKH